MITSYKYDTFYQPPCPVIEIGVSETDANEPGAKIVAIVDLGADVTILPRHFLKNAGARYLKMRRLKCVD